MDKVNFLQQNGQQKKRGKDKAENKQPRDDWTEPAVDNNGQAAPKSGKQKIKKLFGRFGMSKKEPVNKLEDKEKQQARKEILASIKDKNIDSRAQREAGAAVSAPGGLILSDKEAIAQVQEAATQEKEQRRNGLSPVETVSVQSAPASQETEPSKPPAKGAAVISALKADAGVKPKKSPGIPKKQTYSQSKSSWRAPKILKTNLAEGELTAFFNWQKFFKSLGANLLLACLLIGIAYFGLVLWEMKVDREGELIGAEIENLTQRVIQLEKNVASADELQRKIELAKFLIDKHIYWTNFFALLERSTLEEVYYISAFSGDVNNSQFTLAAMAKSYADISNQIKAMEHDQDVVSVEVKSGSMATSKSNSAKSSVSDVQFQLVFSIKPELFTK